MKIIYKNRIANYLNKLNLQSKFDIVDIGAKGDISGLLKTIGNKYLNIIGFEPNKNEFDKLIENNCNRTYFNIGVFDKKIRKDFFITEEPAASSFFKPSTNNKIYEKRNWQFRKIKKKIKINCNKLDNLYKKINNIDFLKIDTQGSEYEIIYGASGILKKYSPIVLAETWSTGVYEKTKLFHEVVQLMDKLNYRVIDIDTAAASWRFNNPINFTDYDVPVKNGFEVLFIKNNNELIKMKENKILKTIILLDLFGYKSFAYYLLRSNKNISNLNYIKFHKLIKKLNLLDYIMSLFPINLIIKILTRYKLMSPVNPQLHY